MAMSQWVEIVDAAGFESRKLPAMDVYLLADRIIHDEWLTARATKFVGDSVLPAGIRTKIVMGLSDIEKQALRERVRLA